MTYNGKFGKKKELDDVELGIFLLNSGSFNAYFFRLR